MILAIPGHRLNESGTETKIHKEITRLHAERIRYEERDKENGKDSSMEGEEEMGDADESELESWGDVKPEEMDEDGGDRVEIRK